jgi:ADP-ribose pyrophosphatase YjhB (NUDIX family)
MGVWKMPTGLLLAGEDVSEAAEREVLEETVRLGQQDRYRKI